jgi:hypothetical protein
MMVLLLLDLIEKIKNKNLCYLSKKIINVVSLKKSLRVDEQDSYRG